MVGVVGVGVRKRCWFYRRGSAQESVDHEMKEGPTVLFQRSGKTGLYSPICYRVLKPCLLFSGSERAVGRLSVELDCCRLIFTRRAVMPSLEYKKSSRNLLYLSLSVSICLYLSICPYLSLSVSVSLAVATLVSWRNI